ncbi:MAG: TVP38/TMEM64 family protein [Nitrospirae bacterium]|nr:MAG: TVP38/TMEM64 family protein [Nitrospirota bacterium]
MEEFVLNRYYLSIVIYIIVYTVSTALSVPGAAVLTLSGGFVFGAVYGAIYSNIGATAGATLAFLFSRYLIGEWVQKKYKERLRRFNEELAKSGHLYLLTLRLIPAFPFFLINFFAGLAKVPLRTFLWTTAVGIIPGDIAYSFAGSRLNTIESVEDIFSARMLIALAFLALLILFPVIYKKLKYKR